MKTDRIRGVAEADAAQSDPSPEQIRAGLGHILLSEEFVGSAQLSRFLRHVVENALENNGASLKESVIGVQVFNRGPGYDPKTDPIVRVEARRLRSRLEAYYRTRGGDDAVRISLPKGGYAPLFGMRVATTDGSADAVVSGQDGVAGPELGPSTASPSRKIFSPSKMAFAATIAVILGGAGLLALRSGPQVQAPVLDRFWSSILSPERAALVIPADSALVLLQDVVHQRVQLQEYITGEYRARLSEKDPQKREFILDLSSRRYTSMVDLDFVARLSRRAELLHRGLSTRYARDVRVEDLKGTSVIILGALHSNPWMELFEKDTTFRLAHDEVTTAFQVVNTRPQPGEQPMIAISPRELRNEIFGIITYHRNRGGSGYVMAVAGTSATGTEAAADFVLDDASMKPWVTRAASGGEIRGFDLLLHDRNLAGRAPRAEVVAFHVEQ